ncbi:MAG: hypothetical protein ABI171_17235 [Collimonas sp.]|uniref:hypothetical protein n=1 Tax=Collimonas sp. TaxID=1963772 RepID=UPI0032666FE3
MSKKDAAKLGKRELLGSLGIYAAMLVLSLKFGPLIEPGIWRSDEFVYLRSLENIAIAAALTAGWTFTYGFLENDGYQRLSMFMVWPVMGFAWAMLSYVRTWINR